jgi:hypothetical protein
MMIQQSSDININTLILYFTCINKPRKNILFKWYRITSVCISAKCHLVVSHSFAPYQLHHSVILFCLHRFVNSVIATVSKMILLRLVKNKIFVIDEEKDLSNFIRDLRYLIYKSKIKNSNLIATNIMSLSVTPVLAFTYK